MTIAPPRISAIVPAHNAADTLGATLESLIAQSVMDWEAIIVDDGSSDATSAVAMAVIERDGRIRLLRQPQGGASRARNAGLASARADRVMFLDADDWIAPDYMERMLAALAEDPSADVAYCAYRRALPDGDLTHVNWAPGIARQPFEAFARRSGAAIHCFVISRSLVMEVGGFEAGLKTCEDWDLWQRAARAGARFVGVPEPLAFYRMRRGSLSGDARQLVADAITVIDRARGVDPRVAKPDGRFIAGYQGDGSVESAACFVCWCAAAQAAQGRRGADLLDLLQRIPDMKDGVRHVCESVFDGLLTGAQASPAQLFSVWRKAAEPLGELFERLEAASTQAGLARRLTAALETELLRHNDLRIPTTLSTMMGVRAEIDAPDRIDPPEGIDSLYLRLCAGDEVLADTLAPLWGQLSPRDVAELAMDTLGFATFLDRGAFSGYPAYWSSLVFETAASGVRAATAAASWRREHRGRARSELSGVRRRAALRAAAASSMLHLPSRPSSRARARSIIAEARADCEFRSGRSGLARPAVAGAANGDLPLDRRGYWERHFATPDPWDYASPYEQVKYQRTLSLLPDARFGRAMELACAEGRFTALLAGKVERLIAVDIAEPALERARALCRGQPNIEFKRLDFFEDPLPHGLDLIVCSEVLYYLDDVAHLRNVAAKLRDAVAPGGCVLAAHSFVLRDDRGRTGFDWDHPFGAQTIANVLVATAGLRRERTLITDLYRIDLFRRAADGVPVPEPIAVEVPLGAPLAPPVARQVVWGGATVLRSEARQLEAAQEVPILMYHRIAEAGPPSLARYRVAPQRFEEQIRLLRRHGFHAITSLDLEQHMTAGRPLPGRPILITFDDGYKDFHDVAWPILRRYDFSAEVFVVTDKIGETADWDGEHGEAASLMNWDEIEALRAEGVRFGSHLASHRPADGLSSEALLREAARSRAVLEARLGDDIASVAYPHGVSDDRVVRTLEAGGYRVGFTTREGTASIRHDQMMLPRIEVQGSCELASFAKSIGLSGGEGGRRAPASAPSDLVTVIVPAYNARLTIGDTLSSIRAQTHTNLEVLVIDDGSTDGTAEIVLRHAAIDSRIRLIRQGNDGVAAARNRGIAEARGEYVAPIDADDLWRPDKIARQLLAFRSGGERVGLVYCWFASIDEKSRVLSLYHRPTDEGNVFARMCLGNLVGNGSAALIRRSVAVEVGGYDPSLRARSAQGCEDWKIQLQIAARYDFAVVRDHLTGYRRTSCNMSSDVTQMIRSYEMVAAEFVKKYPRYSRHFHDGKNYVLSWLLTTAFGLRRFHAAGRLIRIMLAHDRRYALFILPMMPAILVRNALAANARLLKAALDPNRRTTPPHFLADSIALRA